MNIIMKTMAAALALGSIAVATAAPAEAYWPYHRHHHFHTYMPVYGGCYPVHRWVMTVWGPRKVWVRRCL